MEKKLRTPISEVRSLEYFQFRRCVLLPPFGGHPHQSKIGSEEPIFDSFSLKGEAFGGNLHVG